jgi:hypothetical protein
MAAAQPKLKVEHLLDSTVGTSLQGITVCPEGNIYIGPSHCVVKIDLQLKQSLYAGAPLKGVYKDGHRLNEAAFETVGGLRVIDDMLYICDRGAGVVARVEGENVVTWAGSKVKGSKDGPKNEAEFSYPTDIIFFQGKYFISDYDNNKVRIVENGIVTSISCQGRPFAFASMDEEHLFISCHMGNSIREIVRNTDGTFRAPLIAGEEHEQNGCQNGSLSRARFYRTRGLVVAGEQKTLFVADCLNHRIRKLTVEPPSIEEARLDKVTYDALYRSFEEISPPLELASIPYLYASDFCGLEENQQEETGGLNVKLQYPYFMALTPDGDLLWTEEYQKSVKIIRNFDPYSAILRNPCIEMRTDRFLNFGALLQNQRLPHVTLLHQSSQRSFTLHMDILRLSIGHFTETHLKSLETSAVSDFALEQFLAYVYGSLDDLKTLHGRDLAFYWAHNVALLNRLELKVISSDLFAFAVLQFVSLLPNQTLDDLLKMLVIIENEGISHDIVSTSLTRAISNLLGENSKDSASLQALEGIKDEKRRTVLASKISSGAWPPIPASVNFPFTSLQKGLEIISQAIKLQSDSKTSKEAENSAHASANDPKRLPEALGSLAVNHSQSGIKGRFETYHSTCALHAPVGEIIPPNLVVGIEKTDYSVQTHDWILYARWRYFRRAVDSGIWDVTSKRFDLPEDFPPSLLAPLLQWISSGGTFMTAIASDYDCLFLQLRGGEFDLMDMDGVSKPGFARLLEHSRRRLLKSPNLENCIPAYYFAVESGIQERAKLLKDYITAKLDDILASPTLAQELTALPEHIAKDIQTI